MASIAADLFVNKQTARRLKRRAIQKGEVVMAILPRRPKSYDPPSPGWHDGVITAVEDASSIISPFDDADNPKEKVKLTYRMSDETNDDGDPKEFAELYTNSLHEKAKLYAHLQGLMGDDVDKLGDLEDLIGTPCRVNVGSREGKEGGNFAKVTGLAPSTKPFEATRDQVPF